MPIRAAVVWLATFGIYLFLSGSADIVELAAAVVCAAVATGSALALHMVGERRFRLRPPLRVISGPLGGLVTETIVVGRALWTAATGRAVAAKTSRQPFDHGGDDPADAGRRAVVVIGLSLAPQSFVVREEEGALLVHSFPATSASSDRRWPA